MKQTRAIKTRIRQLQNSKLLKGNMLLSLPKEDKKLLAEGKHPDKELQRKYNRSRELLIELMRLRGTLVPTQTREPNPKEPV